MGVVFPSVIWLADILPSFIALFSPCCFLPFCIGYFHVVLFPVRFSDLFGWLWSGQVYYRVLAGEPGGVAWVYHSSGYRSSGYSDGYPHLPFP